MNTNPTNRKAVEDLAVGQHIVDAGGVHEIRHCLPFRDGDGKPSIALTFRPLGKGEPWVGRYAEGVKLHLATADEVREFHEVGRRKAAAGALHKLADDIVRLRLPLPRYSIGFSAGVLESRADLDRWAEYIGAEVRGGTPTDRIPAVDGARPVVDHLRLDFHAQADPVREPVVKPLEVDAAIDAAKALEPKDTGRVAECGCHVFQLPLEDAEEAIHDTACRDWYFTFGPTHVHPESPATNPEGGRPLGDRYVVIRGTYEIARALMRRFFGQSWCDQYESAERAGVAQFGLTQLARRHWPTPAGAHIADASAGE